MKTYSDQFLVAHSKKQKISYLSFFPVFILKMFEIDKEKQTKQRLTEAVVHSGINQLLNTVTVT